MLDPSRMPRPDMRHVHADALLILRQVRNGNEPKTELPDPQPNQER